MGKKLSKGKITTGNQVVQKMEVLDWRHGISDWSHLIFLLVMLDYASEINSTVKLGGIFNTRRISILYRNNQMNLRTCLG